MLYFHVYELQYMYVTKLLIKGSKIEEIGWLFFEVKVACLVTQR